MSSDTAAALRIPALMRKSGPNRFNIEYRFLRLTFLPAFRNA